MTLKDIEITIKKGEFVCIIGDVGAGKSSFLNAIIGELIYTKQTFLDQNSEKTMEDSFIETMTAHGNQEVPLQEAPIVISESMSFV